MAMDLHVSAKACIVRGDEILLVQYQEDGEIGYHYNLPGGRVQPNETLVHACSRKVLEETGGRVQVGELLFVYEYIGRNHDFVCGDKHSVSIIFKCHLEPGSVPSMGCCTKPDQIQTGISWIPIQDLLTVKLFPRIQSQLQQVIKNPRTFANLYWGDIL